MKIIKQKYIIKATIDKVWEALVDSKIIKEWTGSSAHMDSKVGTKFKLWGGDIHGENLKVIKNNLLEQNWYEGNWDKPSKVSFTLVKKGEQTQVDLVHTDFPEDEGKDLDDGWKRYYLGAIKELLES
jgi:uncharacterized protein YndB with AHSA1/START domain